MEKHGIGMEFCCHSGVRTLSRFSHCTTTLANHLLQHAVPPPQRLHVVLEASDLLLHLRQSLCRVTLNHSAKKLIRLLQVANCHDRPYDGGWNVTWLCQLM